MVMHIFATFCHPCTEDVNRLTNLLNDGRCVGNCPRFANIYDDSPGSCVSEYEAGA